MLRYWSLAILTGLAVFCVGDVWADVPPINPPPPQGDTLPLVVKVDPNATVSKLILPPDAAGEEEEDAPAAAPPRAVPGAPGLLPPPAAPEGAFQSPLRSIAAGLCLSLAIAAVFFIPRTGGLVQMVLVGAVGLSAMGIGAAAFADLAPFPPQPRPRPQPIAAGQLANGRVEIQWTGRRGAPVTLIIAGRHLRAGAVGGAAAPPRDNGEGVIRSAPPVPAPLPIAPPGVER